MKKTLQEEKERFHQIVEQGSPNMAYGFKPNEIKEAGLLLQGHVGDLKVAIEKFIQGEKENNTVNPTSPDEIKQRLMKFVESFFDGSIDKSSEFRTEEDPEGSPSISTNPHETDEYHQKYDKNMSQGFSSINEGNAFVGAAKKAKEEGKDSFQLGGKTYKVTVTASKK